MRNLSIIAFFALIVLSACEKNDYTILESYDSGQKYAVSFTTLATTKFGSVPKILNDVKKEYIRIYNLDEGGVLVSSSKTNNQLPAGNYVAVFVYSDSFFSRVYGLGGTSEIYNFDNAFFDTRYSVGTQGLAIDDILYKKVYFQVKKKDVNQTVKLDRIVADLEVIIGDEVPASVSKLELSVNDLAIFKFNTESRESPVDKIKRFSPPEKVLNIYVLGQGARAVTVRAYDIGGGLLKEKRIIAAFTEGKKTTLNVSFSDLVAPTAIAAK